MTDCLQANETGDYSCRVQESRGCCSLYIPVQKLAKLVTDAVPNMAGMNSVVFTYTNEVNKKNGLRFKNFKILGMMCNMSTEMFSTMRKFAGGVVTGCLKTFMTHIRNWIVSGNKGRNLWAFWSQLYVRFCIMNLEQWTYEWNKYQPTCSKSPSMKSLTK